MYIVITENKVYQHRILSQLAKKMDAELKPDDFKLIGRDHVMTMTNNDLSYVQDIKEIERVSLGRLFRPKPLDTGTVLAIVNTFFLILVLVRR